MADNSDDDVPPLEDMSEVLQKLNISGSQVCQKATNKNALTETTATSRCPTEKVVLDENPSKTQSSTKKPPPPSSTQPTQKTFGGMKKGFLFGGPSRSKPVKRNVSSSTSAVPSDDLPFIKPKQTEEKPLELPEVQRVMNESNSFLQNKDWVTEDLLAKIQSNPALFSKLSNPAFTQALSEIQTDPQAAKTKYSENPEMTNFLQDFCAILGDHFSKLSAKEDPAPSRVLPKEDIGLSVQSSTNPNQPTAQDELRMQDILQNAEVREAIQDSQIQKVIHLLREDPEKAQSFLRTPDPSLQKKIKVLVDHGVLDIQR